MTRESRNSRPDIAVIFDNFGPYHQARLKGSAAVCKVHGIQLSGSSKDYAWVTEDGDGCGISTIVPEGPCTMVSKNEFKKRLEATLGRLRPAAIAIPGWSSLGAFVALEWAKKNKVPVILMSESTAWDETRIAWKEWVKKNIVSMASTALVGGHPHADYMKQLGMPSDRISLGYDAVDNAYFATESERWRGQFPEVACRKYFLSSNRFIEKKNLFRLLEAYARYCAGRQGTGSRGQESEHKLLISDHPASELWPLVMLGDGELREKLLAHCEALGLVVIESAPWEQRGNFELGILNDECDQPSVYFPGFRQIDELPRFYAHAGAFVHASTTEQWGLVVNEAMASGLPVIVSNRVGCAMDLVQEGENGFTFDPYDVEQLTSLLGRISAFDFPLSNLGGASRSIISSWGPERFGEGLKVAAEKALEVGPRKPTWIQKLLLETLKRK